MKLKIAFLALLTTSMATAEDSAPPDANIMRLPNSPAFSALGIAPAEIQRPTSPAAFGADIVSRLRGTQQGVTIPQGLAVEFAPYWLTPRYKLTFDGFANEGLASIYRNATLSMATSGSSPSGSAQGTAASATPTSGTDVAFGVKTTILHPGLGEAQRKCMVEIHEALHVDVTIETQVIDKEARTRADAEWAELHPAEPVPRRETAPKEPEVPEKPTQNVEGIDVEALQLYEAAQIRHRAWEAEDKVFRRRFLAYRDLLLKHVDRVRKEFTRKAQADQADATLKAKFEPCLRLIQARGNGLSVDVATAFAWSFRNARFDDGALRQALAWGTLGYAWGNSSLVALGRYVGRDAGDHFNHGFDLGLRAIYAQHRFGTSLEVVNRRLQKSERRFAIGFDYRLAGNTWLTTAFGKDYGKGTKGDLIAAASIAFNFGDARPGMIEAGRLAPK